MHALLIVDAQNEFSPRGQRAVPNHATAISAITRWVAHARSAGWPIAWVQHHNRPDESKAFVPGSWGAQLSPELDSRPDMPDEILIQKDVFGAFTTTALEAWLRARGVTKVVIVGFYAHMCVSTSVREALVRGFDVVVDPEATGARALEHDALGRLTADEVRQSALLQVVNMGATVAATPQVVGRSAAGASAKPAA